MPTDAHPIKGYVRLFRISRQRACPIRKRQAAAAVGALTCFLMPRNCREANVTSETRRPSFSVYKELWIVRHIGNDFLLVAKSSCTTHVIAVYFSFLPICNKELIAFQVECHARRLFFIHSVNRRKFKRTFSERRSRHCITPTHRESTDVAGGQTIISTAVGERAPAMIFFSCTIEPCSPFIFQFATTSGWRALAMFSSPGLGQRT